MRAIRLIGFYLLTLNLIFTTFALAGELESAMDLYRGKQYADAAESFLLILQHQPNNASAAYYAAYSEYGAGKKPESINLLWYVAKKFPSTKEGYSARAFLKTIDATDFLQHSRDNGFGVLPVSTKSNAAVRSITASAAPVNSAAEKERIVNEMVELTPRRSKLDVTPEFTAKIKEALKEFPLNVLAFLNHHNCKFIISPNVTETDFRMTNFHPGGYEEGMNMENVPALFNGKNIVIGEWAKDYKGDYQENEGVVGTMRHEAGHAIDRYMGWVSDEEEFKHQFDLDGDQQYRKKLDYFMRSKHECFAELVCFRLGGRTDRYREENCQLLNKTYPLCGKIVDKYLAKVH